MYTQIDTPTMVQGRGDWNPSPEFFSMLHYFETILPLVEILWVVALLEACDVTNKGRHLRFYQELEIRLKPRETVFFVIHMKGNT